MFEKSHFYEHVPKSDVFVTVQDAVAQAQFEQEEEARVQGMGFFGMFGDEVGFHLILYITVPSQFGHSKSF